MPGVLAGTRDVLAEWITAPNNPYFARAAVNRLWARFFGVGLVEPVDDLDASDDLEFAKLLDELAGDFRDHGYERKYLSRALMATRAYLLTSAAALGELGAPLPFAWMPVRGLSPGQFLELPRPGKHRRRRGRGLGPPARTCSPTLRRAARSRPRTSILQALLLMNGTFIADVTKPGDRRRDRRDRQRLYLDTAGRVEALYLAALTRRPRPEESALVVKYVDRHKTEAERTRALADAFWALLNGPEFRLNH